LSNYTLVVVSDEYSLPSESLAAGGYAVIIDSAHSVSVQGGALEIIQDMDITKSEDVFLRFNGNNVDSYTYDFKASASANKSAQRIDATLRNSDSSNYCEATPTPGILNSCQ